VRIHRALHHVLLLTALAAIFLAATPAAAQDQRPQSAAQQAAQPQTEGDSDTLTNQWYSTQLHVHGWSNHNGAVQPASIEMNAAWAASVGMDVIWWADHNPSFTQTTDSTVSFAGATINPNTSIVNIPLPPGTPWWAVYNYITQFQPSFSGNGQGTASLSNNMLRMELQANADQTFDRFQYRGLSTDDFRVQGLEFTRPLVSDPVLSFDATRCDAASSDTYAEVRIGLSWHNFSAPVSHNLIYRLVPANQAGSIVHSSSRVTVTVPLTGAPVQLPLLEHASLLPNGDDNAIQDLYLTVGAKNNATACMTVGNFNIHSRVPQTTQILQAYRDVLARNQAATGVAQVATWEQFSGVRHLNPYLATTSTLLPGLPDIQVENFVPLIHSQDGLVMLNHPFGAGYGNPDPAPTQDARVQAALSELLANQAWDLDMIEIYKLRGRVDLQHHLDLWDLLGVNGHQLCATSTSDAHGAPFTLNHAMVAWIHGSSTTRDGLLPGLRSCRVFFGDLRLFDGVLDLRLGSTPMGSVYPTRPGMQPLHITVDPLPAGAQVKLVQQRLQPGTTLIHLVDHQIVDPTQPVMIDVSQPSQVRVEVWSASNQMMAFSNRIVIQPLQCDTNNNGQLDIADVQVVAGAFGQSVPPAPARYDLRPDSVIDLWDVTAAAECWLTR
jgi:hypothetical protein